MVVAHLACMSEHSDGADEGSMCRGSIGSGQHPRSPHPGRVRRHESCGCGRGGRGARGSPDRRDSLGLGHEPFEGRLLLVVHASGGPCRRGLAAPSILPARTTSRPTAPDAEARRATGREHDSSLGRQITLRGGPRQIDSTPAPLAKLPRRVQHSGRPTCPGSGGQVVGASGSGAGRSWGKDPSMEPLRPSQWPC